MGDRGNIVVEERTGGKIYFYTHWMGSELPSIVAEALNNARDRWDDEPYMSRVFFSHMLMADTNEDVLKGSTGYGISTYASDGGTEVFINYELQTVSYEGEALGFDDYINRYIPERDIPETV